MTQRKIGINEKVKKFTHQEYAKWNHYNKQLFNLVFVGKPFDTSHTMRVVFPANVLANIQIQQLMNIISTIAQRQPNTEDKWSSDKKINFKSLKMPKPCHVMFLPPPDPEMNNPLYSSPGGVLTIQTQLYSTFQQKQPNLVITYSTLDQFAKLCHHYKNKFPVDKQYFLPYITVQNFVIIVNYSLFSSHKIFQTELVQLNSWCGILNTATAYDSAGLHIFTR